MGIELIHETIHALQQAGIPAQRGLPVGKIPCITAPVAAVCIDKIEPSIVTLAVRICTSAKSGGAACEDAALQAAQALGQIGAVYQIRNVEFDGKSGLFGITVLVTFSRVYDPIE